MTDTPSSIERLPLEHPLPEEIQQMTRDDTVCTFCGVSYLIHHEVKRLEKELVKVQAELEKYKGCEEREKQLKVDVEKLGASLSEKDKILSEREASIGQLKTNIKTKEDELWKTKQQSEATQRQLETEKAHAQKLRTWKSSMLDRLPAIKIRLGAERQTLDGVRTELSQCQSQMNATAKKLTSVIQKVCLKEKQVVEGIVSRAKKAEQNAASLQTQLTAAQEQVASSSTQGQRLQEVEGQIKQLEAQCAELRAAEQRLHDELQDALTSSRTAKSEAVQIKELLRNKTREVEEVQQQRTKHEQYLSNSINKLQDELRCRADEAQKYQREIDGLKEKEAERKRRLEAVENSKKEASVREMRQLQEALESARKDCSALREERETMVTSHQHRIEQLKQSFAQRIQDAEGWPEKLNECLSKEREKQARELASLEEKLQKSFQVDLEIQKQRNEELIMKYKQDLSNAETKLKSNLRDEKESLKTRLEGLERELAESKKLAAAQEKALREEIDSLQKIIASLRKELAQGDSKNDGELQALRAELHEAEQDLSSLQQDKASLSKKLEQSKEEIGFLQETVHRECEERFELTEALSKAREQLLMHQRGSTIANSGNGPSVARSHSQLSLERMGNSPQRGVGNSTHSPHQPSSPKTASQPGVGGGGGGLRRSSSSSNGLGNDRTAKNQGGGGGGLNDKRNNNRLSNVVGKKEYKFQINP